MGKSDGFLEYKRSLSHKRPVQERLKDYQEIAKPLFGEEINKQGADRKSTRLNSSHRSLSRMPSSA